MILFIQCDFFCWSYIYSFQISNHWLKYLVENKFCGIPNLIDDTPLDFSIQENGFNRLGKTCQTIYARNQNIFHSTVLQPVQNGKPELCALILPDIHAKRIFVSFHINPYGDINHAFYTPTFVAYMVMDAIHKNNCIDFFQGSCTAS